MYKNAPIIPPPKCCFASCCQKQKTVINTAVKQPIFPYLNIQTQYLKQTQKHLSSRKRSMNKGAVINISRLPIIKALV